MASTYISRCLTIFLILDPPLELEHFFAQNIEEDPQFNALGGFVTFGIADRSEFEAKVLWRSGNLTWLSGSANVSLGNAIPAVKAPHYCQCQGHPHNSGRNICTHITITGNLGSRSRTLGANHRAYRLWVEVRCAELALFAVERFC